jgi:hypothetical protein
MRNQPLNEYTVAVDTYGLVSGDMRRRALGVLVFAIGVIVGTAANLVAP